MEEFATEASKAVPPFQSIYLSQDDEIIEPFFAKVAPDIQGTLDTYYVKRSFNSTAACLLEFYRSSKDLEPFHVQHYSGSESNKSGCCFCKELYHEDEKSLQCPFCKIWFYGECFGKYLFS